jgi:hypothetical protein
MNSPRQAASSAGARSDLSFAHGVPEAHDTKMGNVVGRPDMLASGLQGSSRAHGATSTERRARLLVSGQITGEHAHMCLLCSLVGTVM